MLVKDFDFELPKELIAQKPLPRRDQSRMMVINRKKKKISHTRFHEIPRYFQAEDVLVLNSTKVIPARIWGRTGSREIEFLFLKEQGPECWEVLCRPAKKVRPGEAVISAHLNSSQLLSIAISYDPGWHATVNGKECPIQKDALGLIVVEPACNGPCRVRLVYDGGPEMAVARCASVGVLFIGLAWLVWSRRRSRTDPKA